MAKNHRAERLGEEIKKVIGDMLIRGDLKDPRFKGMIGISGADVSADGSHATLYLTALSYNPEAPLTAEDRQGIISAFEHSEGYIRNAVGKAVKVRYVPEMHFKFDESFEYGAKMDKILDSLK